MTAQDRPQEVQTTGSDPVGRVTDDVPPAPAGGNAAITHGNLTFVDIGEREAEVRHPEGNWNGLAGVCDRFALYGQDTFEEGVQDYIADMERS